MRTIQWTIAVVALALAATACTGDDGSAGAGHDSSRPTTEAAFTVRGSVGQVVVTGAEPGTTLALVDPEGRRVAEGEADDLGALIFRELTSGRGYRVQEDGAEPVPTSPPVDVMAAARSTPPPSFYEDQVLEPGFGYIETRDGTLLSAAVYLPGPPEEGPYPTVVEYSGYSPSNPTNSLGDELADLLPDLEPEALCDQGLTVICETPDQPASVLAAAMGYAVVAVNIRGTGCSGGAFDFFEELQVLDGYDVIETVAAQDWVADSRVGMVGLSYPAVAQLFVARSHPPSLAAITPLSVYDDTARGVLAPGGIFNKGFALSWAAEVIDEAGPFGQEWTKELAAGGDETCAANQTLRLQNVDPVEKARRYEYYTPEVADPLNIADFAPEIDVPVFLACAFQDEQTGGRCARLADRFTGTDVARFTFYNGAHSDGFAPQVLVEWKAFLDLYVAGELRPIDPLLVALAPALLGEVFGTAPPFPRQRWVEDHPDTASARAAFEAEDPVRVIFENGAGSDDPGSPVGRYQAAYPEWPPPARAVSWYLQPGGGLAGELPPEDGGASGFVHDADLGDRVTLPGSSVAAAFEALPPYEWDPDRPGGAAVFVSEPLTNTTTMVGGANADLWIQAGEASVDVGVTLSEVRPDGGETYVQSGRLRAEQRALAPGSTELDPRHTGFESDAAPLPDGEWARAQIEIFPFAHVFRRGSRVRLSVHTPGGDQPRWSWILPTYDTPPTIGVAHHADHPSRLVLPVVAAAAAPATPPPCPSLRGQPCRPFTPYLNTPYEG